MFAICHRDILEDYSKEGYFGDRADILSQMIEDSLINDEEVANSFGIGKLSGKQRSILIGTVFAQAARHLSGKVLKVVVTDFHRRFRNMR